MIPIEFENLESSPRSNLELIIVVRRFLDLSGIDYVALLIGLEYIVVAMLSSTVDRGSCEVRSEPPKAIEVR